MKKLFLISFLSITSTYTYSQTQIAACENPKGYVFYPHISPIPKNKSGWTQDAITGGRSILVRKSDGKFDILFTDTASKKPISSIDDGGQVVLLRNTSNQISVLINYDAVTEIYTYWRTTDGQLQYSLIQSKSGTVPKSAVLVGTCQFINFNF